MTDSPPFKGNHREFGPGHGLHDFEVEVIDRSHADGADAQLLGILLA